MQKTKTFYLLLSLAAIGIIALPVGIANIFFGYVFGDSPCTLCWGQRQSMIFIAISVLFILRYGLKFRYIAMLLIITGFGLWESFYHLGSHALEDVGQGFGLAILGLHTQFWAEVVFWAVVMILGIIFFFAPSVNDFVKDMNNEKIRKLTTANIVAFWVFFIVVASNIVQAFVSTGPPPFLGQGDPVRYSWNSKYTVWSTETWGGLWKNQSIMGKRDVNEPDLASKPTKDIQFSSDYKSSPLVIDKVLNLVGKNELNLSLNAPISDMSFQNDKMLITTEKQGFYIANKELSSIGSNLVLDPYFSATIGSLVGANYIDKDTIRLMGDNKTSADVKENPKADSVANFRFFTQGADKFDEVNGRNRLKTSRAKNYYILSMRSDGKYSYAFSVPNNKYKKLILIEQLNKDGEVTAEYTPELASNVSLKDGRALGELYITGSFVKDGLLYAVSKNFNTIIALDPKTREIKDVFGIPKEVKNIRAMALVEDKILISSFENGKNTIYTLSF
ncbi:disulfide bond formation protein B [Campylobacter geochelonis]|uniref:disulfide bond formation protein B n=1 Tax=Campylobacter geochelonis TaxID=1780362 RepID=UPI000770798C|nr:disulfide bond formation protein B [Campylobacter geochelonis]CZE47691.1 DsbB family disulfide bond formation protein [Campylobacter geochelonis]CZE50135.1 DsbB family disulfide bond formation protein [Campylobacter geochelonis]